FTFGQELGIDASWTKLKEYRRKSEHEEVRNTYPDNAMFILPATALQKQECYSVIIDTSLTNQSLSIEEKLRILQEKEAQMMASSGNKETCERSTTTNLSTDEPTNKKGLVTAPMIIDAT
ncbi:hypothetical protein E4U58_002622, partial [Claviceps cyperi]